MTNRVDLSALDALAAKYPLLRGDLETTAFVDGLGRVIARVAVTEIAPYQMDRGQDREDIADALTAVWAAYPALAAELRALRGALEEIDANTPTQSFVVEVRKHPEPRAGFFDAQQSLANIGDIARAALGSQP